MRFVLDARITALGLVCLVAGCSPEAPRPAPSLDGSTTRPGDALQRFAGLDGTLRIAGGTAHLGVMEEARRRITTFNPGIQITVEGGGSGVGVKKVGEGLVEIGNTGRALSEDEVRQYGLLSFCFAIDGVCAVLHSSNPVETLTTAQLKDIFAGRVTTWRELGGEDRPINLYNRDRESGTRAVFWKAALEKGEMTEKANFVTSNGAMKTAVANDPAGIGYLSIGYVDASVKAPTLDGVAPTQENAIAGAYRVTRKLFMNTRGEPAGLTRAFIDYVRSDEGAGIVTARGYIPAR